MMKHLFVMGLMALFVSATGCRMEPAEMAVMERDRETYVEPRAVAESSGEEAAREDGETYVDSQGATARRSEEALPVAILVSEPVDEKEAAIYEALDSSLTSVISDFDFFTIIERSNLSALQKEHTLENLSADSLSEIEIPEADYLITAKIGNARLEKQLLGNYQGVVDIDFRFYEKPTDRTVLTKNIVGKSGRIVTEMSGTEANAALAEAATEAAKAFAIELGSRYAPEARVLETRGGGKVARINIGYNYGVTENSKVEFYEYVDNSDIVEGAEREASPVGYGNVIEVDQDGAWADVMNYKNVHVMRGHYVRLAPDQSRGMKDKMRSSTQLF